MAEASFFQTESMFFMLMGTCLLVGIMLLISWVHHRAVRAYLWWGGGFLTSTLGLGLIAARNYVPDGVSSGIGTTLILVGLGLCWGGARSFDNRPVHAYPLAFSLLIWSAIYFVPAFHESTAIREIGLSALIAFYSFLIASEFWEGRDDSLNSRLPLTVLCAMNGVLQIGRVVLSFFDMTSADVVLGDFWLAISLLQPCLLLVAGGLYGISLGRDRVEKALREATTLDPLTGVLNRVSFVGEAERRLAELRNGNKPVALILFDIDGLQSINDRHGLQAGDMALKAFAEIAQHLVRGSDLIGRIGGEEFVALLPEADHNVARLVAGRIRHRYSEHDFIHGDVPIRLSLSAGMVALSGSTMLLDRLMSLAERALYEAKSSGRNQVHSAMNLTQGAPEPELKRA